MSSAASPATSPRRGLWRWSVALVATALFVVSGSSLVALAQRDSATGKGPQFVPADAAAYLEIRLDMPAGQDEALAELMTALPGFADTGSFRLKLGEAVRALISDATGGAGGDVDPLASFATGEIGVALMDLADVVMSGAEEPPVLVGVAISDREAAEAFVDSLMSGLDADLSEQTYGDASIVSAPDASVAVTDEWLLISPTLDMVESGVDTLESVTPSLADDPDFEAAFERVPAAHLGAAYLDLASFGPFLQLAAMAAEGQSGMGLEGGDLVELLPVDMVGYLAAEPDRMHLAATITPSEATPSLAVGESDVSLRFPADTQVYVETRDLGATIEGALSQLLASMDDSTMASIAPFEDMLGEPLPEYLDFVGDAGIGGGISSDGLWVGMAAEVSDEAVASQRLERIMSIVRLVSAGTTGEDGEATISVDTETIGDETVTVITAPLQETVGGDLPFAVGDTISIALSDGTLLLGSADFVATALSQTPEDSLGESAAYTDALADETPNSGLIYADLGSLLAELDPMLGEMAPEWADIAPYASALDRFIAVGSGADDLISVRASVIVGS